MRVSLRDMYAAHAMQGLLSNQAGTKPNQVGSKAWNELIAKEAFDIADAMLLESTVGRVKLRKISRKGRGLKVMARPSDCKSTRLAAQFKHLYLTRDMSISEVAQAMGVCKSTVVRGLHLKGVNTRVRARSVGKVVKVPPEQLLDMYKNGMTLERISELQGVSRQRIQQIIRKLKGYEPRPSVSGRCKDKEMWGKVLACAKSGVRFKDIAGEVGCSVSTVYRVLKETEFGREKQETWGT